MDYCEKQKKYVLLRIEKATENKGVKNVNEEANLVCCPEEFFDEIESCHCEAG